HPEIVVPTNENDGTAPSPDLAGGFSALVTNILSNAIGGSGRIYALSNTGQILPGWPLKPGGALPDALPFVGPGVDHALADIDGDGKLDVIGNVASGDVTANKADGSLIRSYDSQPATGEAVDKSKIINLFENPIVANFDDTSPGL